jgi:hypothetical protein
MKNFFDAFSASLGRAFAGVVFVAIVFGVIYLLAK